jgi:hypothetical protein
MKVSERQKPRITERTCTMKVMVHLFEVRVAIEADHFVCNAVDSEEVANCFRHKQYNLMKNAQ